MFISFFYVHKTRLHLLNFLKGPPTVGTQTQAALAISEEDFLLGHPSIVLYTWNFTLEPIIISGLSSDNLMSSDKAQGPIYYFGPLPLQWFFIYFLKSDFHNMNHQTLRLWLYMIFFLHCLNFRPVKIWNLLLYEFVYFFIFLIFLFWIVLYFLNCFNNLFFNYISFLAFWKF